MHTAIMKSPRISAALLAMPLLFALIGIIVSMQKASFLNYSITLTGDSQKIKTDQVVYFGNTQFRVGAQSAILNGQPVPESPGFQDLNTTGIKSACPDINGSESCSTNGGISTCVPSMVRVCPDCC